MLKKSLFKFIPLCIMLTMMTWGCSQNKTTALDSSMKPAVAQKQEENVYKGKIVGKSNKAKTISIEVGKGDKAQTMMVRFDDRTRGTEHAAKGEAAIIAWEMRGSDKYATVIKPKLAKLPDGVAEIKSQELKKLMDSGADLVVVDSRPSGRYAQAHLPGAISIPVEQMPNQGAELLPGDKDKLLVFYCGGPT
ncbi:MAG: rhodanese-like domain-containing protein [Desulfobulbaceae bacterium]|nr:rhodanese-like domain-containing protein [Desulfobulbaceae bacterium]